MKKDLNIVESVCNEKEMTIEEQVSLCFPKATKEEQQRIAAEWKAKARRMAKEPDFGLMQFQHDAGHWQTVKREGMSGTTATRYGG